MISLLLALGIANVGLELPPTSNLIPDVNLSAIRFIDCDEWSGSGYLIGDNQLVTDNHVASGTNCVDVLSGAKLKTYAVDEAHDLALMTGALPKMPYIKISCEPYKMGEEYSAYGYSSYPTTLTGVLTKNRGPLLFRQYNVVATGVYFDVTMDDGTINKGMSGLVTFTVPGTSGGAIIDRKGFAHGNVVAGNSILGIPTGKAYSFEFTNTIMCPPIYLVPDSVKSFSE